MNLKEAKQELIEHGYIIEDTDPYMNSLDKELDDMQAEKRLKVAMKDVVEAFEALEIPGEHGKTFEFTKQNDYPIEYAAYQKQGDYENCMTIIQSSLDEFGVSIQCRNTKTGKEHGYGKFYLYSQDYKNDLQECIEDRLRLWKKMVETNGSTFKKVVRRALGESINEELEEHGYIVEGMSPTYVKGKRNMYSKMNDRDLVVAFYAHWIGYDSDGMKSGTSNNPTCEKIDNMLYQRLGLVWHEASNVLNDKVNDITEKAYPIKGKPRYIDIMKQAKESWPHVVIYLIDNMGKVFQDAREKVKANEEEYKSRGYSNEEIWGEDVKGKL